MTRRSTSHKRDLEPVKPEGQAPAARSAGENLTFGARLRVALGERTPAQVARAVGIAPQTLDGYLKGATPSADRALALADELTVDLRWLVSGSGDARATASGDDWVTLPRYDLYDFTGPEKPVPVEEIPLQRTSLDGRTRYTQGLWLAYLPDDATPDLGREGDMIVCRNPDPPLVEGRTYAFLLDGRPVVRKLSIRPEGLVLKAGDPGIDPVTVPPDNAETLVPLGHVVVSISPRSV